MNTLIIGIALAVCISAAFLAAYKAWKTNRVISTGMALLRDRDFSCRLSRVGHKNTDKIVDLFNEMLDSLKKERLQLREQNHLLDLLIDVSPMGIVMLSPSSPDCIETANPSALKMLGLARGADIRGIHLTDIPSGLAEDLANLSDRQTKTLRLSNAMVVRCSRLSFMEKGVSHPFLLLEILTDEVMKAERKAYEKVIRMMAHEVNNSLAGIISVVDTAAECVGDADLQEALEAASRRGQDMGTFITKLASAVKIPNPVRVHSDLRQCLLDWMPMLESVAALSGAEISIALPDKPISAFFDHIQIEQALTNIVKNAAESAGTGGHVKIYSDSERGMLVVEDDGPGISPEASRMLFTPFFTTKPDGHGLGLLLVTEILRSHDFDFSLQTDPDRHTRFRIKI